MLWELPVLGESAVQLAGSVPTEQKVHLVQAQPVRLELPVPRVRSAALERLVVLERLVPWAQVPAGHLEGWVHSVPRERLEPLVLGELVAQLVRLVPLALQVR